MCYVFGLQQLSVMFLAICISGHVAVAAECGVLLSICCHRFMWKMQQCGYAGGNADDYKHSDSCWSQLP